MESFWARFPGGRPGWALVLLRVSVASNLLIDVCWGLGKPHCFWWAVAALLLIVPLLAGFLTPAAAIAALCLELSGSLPGALSGNPIIYLGVLDAAALALLGPGAYSMDSLIFGRRVLTLGDK